MKKLSKLKLNALNEQDLKEKQMNSLRGGEDRYCTCSCYYSGNTGSSSSSNRSANYNSGNGGISSVNGCNQYGEYSNAAGHGYDYCNGCCNESNPGYYA